LAGRFSHSESASALAGSADLDGDGVIGDLTGITTPYCLTTAAIFPGVGLFITGTPSTEAGCAEEPDLSTAMRGRLEDMVGRAEKAEFVPAPSATSTVAVRLEASLRAEVRASMAAVVGMAVAGGVELR
jgi:hypothetical protein